MDITYVMRRSARPVINSRHSYYCRALNLCWDEHVFVSWQNSLTDCVDLSTIINDLHGANSIVTVRLAGKRFADIPIRVTIKTTILSLLAHGWGRCRMERTWDSGYTYAVEEGSHCAISCPIGRLVRMSCQFVASSNCNLPGGHA